AYQVGVYFEELTIKRTAAKYLAKLRIDTRCCAGNVRDIGGRCDSHQCRVTHTFSNFWSQSVPVETSFATNINFQFAVARMFFDSVDRKLALTPSATLEIRIYATTFGHIS